MAKTQTITTIIAAATSNAAAATTRGTADVRTQDGGIVTIKLTNGGTGPTLQAEARILISHNTSTTPTAASRGTDWKTVYRIGGGVTASDITEMSWEFGPGVCHIEVEVTGNTGQAVVCEAIVTTYLYA